MIIRKAKKEDLDDIYMMGFDAWSNGASKSEYLKECRESKKYEKGTWYVLDHNDQVVSSLIVYKNEFNLPESCIGIGSVATSKSYRNNGYAATLVTEVSKIFKGLGAEGVYLFSDIEPEYYKKLGYEFITAKQPYQDTHCMVLAFQNIAKLYVHAPEYF